MTRPLAQHFGPSGKPKRAFASQADAARFLNRHAAAAGTRVYLCDFCGHWHLASPARKEN
ncbi:MAG: hypothetical protein ACYDHH_18960 [Solirubrobacteraceae bacterium]